MDAIVRALWKTCYNTVSTLYIWGQIFAELIRGGFREGRAGHMLYNVNKAVQQTTFSWMVNSWPVVKYSYTL